MKKVKVSIMTNKSYPYWRVKNCLVNVDENYSSYYWKYKDLETAFKLFDDEYLVSLEIDLLEVNA